MQVDEANSNQQLQSQPPSDIYASQRFLKAYLSFLSVLVKTKTRPLQTQLVDPMIRLVTVLPANGTYPINLDCQKLALQILKEITRHNPVFDNTGQLTLLVERLKAELAILKDDFKNYKADEDGSVDSQPVCLPTGIDDSVMPSHTLAKRQDLIGSLLRFLCYYIIRMDPNQISIN